MTYTEKHATKATYRHERRTPPERLRLLRALLCSALGDTDPTFEGEENGAPFKGPTIAEAVCDMLGYFAHRRLPLDRVIALVRAGYYKAEEHDAAMKRALRPPVSP